MAELQIKKLKRLLLKSEKELELVEQRIKTEEENFYLGYDYGIYYGTSELLKEIIKEMEK